MTYVAEPYRFIADQILTGLTGGVMREVHRFFPAANSFNFGIDPQKVAIDTLVVVGQAKESFYQFQRNVDFVITDTGQLQFLRDETDTAQHAAGAIWPDEGTEFFVSYYHADSGKALLTDRNTGSLNRTLAEAFARESAVLRKQLELVYKAGFVDTAEGRSLDMLVALMGINRKTREYATGRVRFYRDTPAPADIFIPQGTKVSTALNPPVIFSTTSNKVLRRGQLSLEIEVRAEEKGSGGIVAAKTITIVNQPVLGVKGVENDSPTLFGGTDESDEELRARVKKIAERVGKATPGAILNALTGIGGLKENEIKLVEDLHLRPGIVKVFVARQGNADLAQKVQSAILNNRPAGVRFEHNLTVALPVSPGNTLSVADARGEGVAEAVSAEDGFEFPLRCELMLYLENPRLPGADKLSLKQEVVNTIIDYIDKLAIGGALVYNRLIARVMAVEGVFDVILSLNLPLVGPDKFKKNIDIPEGQKLTVKEADIAINLAGGPVNFIFYLNVAPKGGATENEIKLEIKDKLVDFFAAGPSRITAADLKSELTVSDNYTLQESGLNWTVEYEDAGLVIREQAGEQGETKISEGGVAVLKEVKVEVSNG